MLFICLCWLIFVCDMTRSCCVMWRCQVTTNQLERYVFIRLCWLIFVCDMTRSCCVMWRCQVLAWVRHDSSMCVTKVIHVCDVTHLRVWQNLFSCVTWLIHMCHKIHSSIWNDAFMCVICRLCGFFHVHDVRTWWCVDSMCVICRYGVATISRLLKKYRSLLQNIVSFIWLFCKRDL